MKIYGWIGLALLLLSEYCLFEKIEPVYSWFYCFAWWSYILLADNLLYRIRGRSLLTGRLGELLEMLPLSVFIWLLFEAFNLRIRNWAYDGVPIQSWIRWPGYALAFSTVLPGIFTTSDLIQSILERHGGTHASEVEPLDAGPPSRPLPWLAFAGLILCILPLVWPRFFFPAVWLGPIFLLDPVLEKLGMRSLSLQASCSDRRRIWSLLLGGLACGLMWEFWNFWAGSKWIYSIPFFGGWKAFEMPVLGFLGFPPFALECWILYHLLRATLHRSRQRWPRIAFWATIALLSLIIFRGIDSHTVARFAEYFNRSIGACSVV